MKYRRFDDGCYAIVIGRKRGPIGHDKVTALRKYRKSGLISQAHKHGNSK